METKKNKQELIKAEIRERYAKAVKQGVSCCGQAREEGEPLKVPSCGQGYGAEELKSLPLSASENSLGCGNPVALAGISPGQTVLDLGSGAGLDCLLAAQRVGPQGKVYGLDMTPEMVAQAQKNARESGFPQVEFLLGEIENIPLPEASADWVISNCVLNLSPDKPRVFKEITRVLRPGGRISISDVVVQELPVELRRSLEAWAACVGGAISEEEYVAGLVQSGLEEVKVTSRYVYSQEEMEAMLAAEISQGGFASDAASLGNTLLEKMEGKIWSAQFEGVKK